MRTFKTIELNIHPAGWPFIGAFAGVALILTLISGILGMFGWILTAWCVYFFRDPDRFTPAIPFGRIAADGSPADFEFVIAPADGIVQSIVTGPAPLELGLPTGNYTRISTFLNVFDVHVQRSPVAGTISGKSYVPGKFVNAALDKASVDNERLALRIDTPNGRQVGCVQIAGLIARRILCYVEAGHTFALAERYGIIRFGSRVDVYLPDDIVPLVTIGQRMIGGESIMAELTSLPNVKPIL